MIQIKDKEFVPFITEEQLSQRVSEIGRQITTDYQGNPPIMIGILNGAFMFLSDLARHIDLPVEISFMRISSYESMSSTGKIKPIIGLDSNLMGRDVIIVEDIVDTGNSISYLLEVIQEQKAKTVQVVSLLLKPEALIKSIRVKYIGFEIANKFVVGYGLDYNGYGRNLKEIYQLK